MDMETRRRLADELLAAETEYQLALQRHDRELTDESREAWNRARRRLDAAMAAASLSDISDSEIVAVHQWG
jgi:glycerol-3-phosphate O-acyltransferase